MPPTKKPTPRHDILTLRSGPPTKAPIILAPGPNRGGCLYLALVLIEDRERWIAEAVEAYDAGSGAMAELGAVPMPARGPHGPRGGETMAMIAERWGAALGCEIVMVG